MAEMGGYDGKSVEGWRRGFVDQSQSDFVERFADDIVLQASALAKPVEDRTWLPYWPP